MAQVKLADAEKKLPELVKLLTSGQQDEIILTQEGDAPAIKMTLEDEAITMKTPETAKRIGIAKGKMNLPPDFDEWFDAMDAEILKTASLED